MKVIRLFNGADNKQFISITAGNNLIPEIIKTMYKDFGFLPYTFGRNEILIDLEEAPKVFKGVQGLREYINRFGAADVKCFSFSNGQRDYFDNFNAYEIDEKQQTKTSIFLKHMLIALKKIEAENGKAEVTNQLEDFLMLIFNNQYKLKASTGLNE